MSRLGSLVTLQRADEEIAARRAEIAALEAGLSGDTELNRRREVEEGARHRRAAAETAAHEAEMDVADLRHKHQRLEKRLYDGSVANPQELMGMQSELAALQQRIDEAEARLLERMEAAEEAEAGLAAAREQRGARERELAESAAPRTERLAAAREELSAAETRRGEAAAGLEAGDLRIYDRVAARRTPAVCRLDGDACGGCHLPLGIAEVRSVRAGELVQCSNCDRILVP